jgi:hypothetical protein
MQLIQQSASIPLRQAARDVVNARSAQIQMFHGYLAIPLNHRLGLGNFPSAPSKKEFSI